MANEFIEYNERYKLPVEIAAKISYETLMQVYNERIKKEIKNTH